MLSLASKARAYIVCGPLLMPVVAQVKLNGAVLSVLLETPSTMSSTRETPTLSAAVTFTVTLPDTVALLAGEEMETVGGVVSATTLLTLKLTEEELPMFPAESVARTRMLCCPLLTDAVFHDEVNGAVVSVENGVEEPSR